MDMKVLKKICDLYVVFIERSHRRKNYDDATIFES